MSNYSATCERLGKPFNPLLNETFEYVSPPGEQGLGGFRYIAEQVGHHPPVSAIHAEAWPPRTDGTAEPAWEFWSDWQPKISPSGTRANVVAVGVSQCRFPSTGEHFSWSKVTTQVNGIIVGKMAITHFGPMKIVNHQTGAHCVLDFEKRGMMDFGPDAGRVTGRVCDAHGALCYRLQGSWNMDTAHLSASRVQPEAAEAAGSAQRPATPVELWRGRARPDDSARQYNFTDFAIGLNQRPCALAEGGGGLPAPTDSTLRPDLRAMEEGKMALAAEEKHRLEQKQRAKRKLRQEEGLVGEPAPRWFRKERCARPPPRSCKRTLVQTQTRPDTAPFCGAVGTRLCSARRGCARASTGRCASAAPSSTGSRATTAATTCSNGLVRVQTTLQAQARKAIIFHAPDLHGAAQG